MPLADNSTLARKIVLRRNLIREITRPVVLEAFGGYGKIWEMCYSRLAAGIVIERNPEKTDALCDQRPTWGVYEADTIAALRAGIGNHLEINFADFDAWGSPWDAIDAFFESSRPWPGTLALVATDGLRQKLKAKGGFTTKQLRGAVERYGNDAMHEYYLRICRELVAEKARRAGYSLACWVGYHCGYALAMTHYAAVLTRD